MTQQNRPQLGRRLSRAAIGMAVAMILTAAPVAAQSTPTGELPMPGFTHASLVYHLVEPTGATDSSLESLADVYAWLANVDRAELGAFIGCPAWLADGSGLILCSGSDGFAEIFEATPDGHVRQLTFLGGQASSPAVSPDGSLLVFEATAGPSTITLADIYAGQDGPQVYVIPRAGKRGRMETVGGVVIVIPGERAVRLTSVGSNYDPTFQPDGERIVFTSDRNGSPSLWSMNVDGTNQTEFRLATVAE